MTLISFLHCFVSESKPRDSYPRYSSPQRVRDFEQQENNNNEFYSGKRDRDYYTPPERNFRQEEPRREMRGEGQDRERTSSYDRGRQYSPYITEKHGDGRNYVESDNGSERNYRKSVGDQEVSLHEILNLPY